MSKSLLAEISEFMREAQIGAHRFGMLSIGNGRLVERLQKGGRIWPDTEAKVRRFMMQKRAESRSEQNAGERQ